MTIDSSALCSEHRQYPYLADIACYLDKILHCSDFQGIDSAFNGLQVGGRQDQHQVRCIVAAVDASLESFERAADLAADLLIVHHGILWGQSSPIVGLYYQRIAFLVEKQLALYAAHLPLDAHLEYGNNIHLAQRLGLQNIFGFASYKGRNIGCSGQLPSPATLTDICQTLQLPEGVLSLEFSRRTKSTGIRSVAIVSGAGAVAIDEAATKGFDLLITGEIAHQHYLHAKELGLNILAMGHYRSETGGVLRLLDLLQAEWPSVTTNFIDLPTSL